ncbi:MATE family efflux transporter [Fretibacter rubidus]|uniref:MATE family efflux transporter n=1 Tax=Fretibacter rubidus TaxID=570162 RepID=UPI00352AD928
MADAVPIHQPLTRRAVFAQSWPIMLANALAPVVGIVDTLVIGRYTSTTALAGIGLGAVIYGIAYWGFGFLRMSTAGLAAQSDGANDQIEVQAHLFRAVPLGFFIGLLVFALQTILLAVAFKVFTASPTIEDSAASYIRARLWGLPATLGSIALMGWFVGISRAGRALSMQIVLNIVNIILSPLFVIALGWGLYGVGIASAIAEWVGLAAGLSLAWAEIKKRGGLRDGALSRKRLLDVSALKKLGISNSNIFIRTMTLTVGFTFFGNAAASEGEVFLASNHILMQFITMIALVLDAFAHTAEAVTGAAFGAKNKARFDRAVRLTTEFSAAFAVLSALLIMGLGPYVIAVLTKDPAVVDTAMTYLPYCALVPVLGFAAYQMDGIFIGTTQTRAMRNAGIMAVLIYLGVHHILQPRFGPHGLWTAFLIYYVARALTLGLYYPTITRQMKSIK